MNSATPTPASGLTKAFASVSAALALAGCSSLPVASGVNSPLSADEQQNTQFCMNLDDAQAKAKTLAVGAPKSEVYAAFGFKGDQDLRRLNKDELHHALYGQTTLTIPFDQRAEAQNFLNALEGRAITCHDVRSKRSFGLTHTQVEKSGYQYTITFIFKDDALYDPVAISGEPVQQKVNRGYLSDFNPFSTAIRAVKPF